MLHEERIICAQNPSHSLTDPVILFHEIIQQAAKAKNSGGSGR